MKVRLSFKELNRKNDLTPEEVRSCKMFTSMSEEEVTEVIQAIKRFTQIVYKSYQKSQEKVLHNG